MKRSKTPIEELQPTERRTPSFQRSSNGRGSALPLTRFEHRFNQGRSDSRQHYRLIARSQNEYLID